MSTKSHRRAVCMYCLQDKPTSDFNTEHVLSQLYGTFKENLTLANHEVCKECNTTFNRELENQLGLDSYEGYMRYNIGHRVASRPHRLMSSGEMRLAQDPYGALPRVEPRAKPTGGVERRMIPQIGICSSPDVVDQYYTEDEFRELPHWELEDKTFLLRTHDQDTSERLQAVVKERVPDYKFRGEIRRERMSDTSTFKEEVNHDRGRLYAKIAFNYLAKKAGKPFVLNESFNKIRRFIRYGEGEMTNLVRPRIEPLLSEETSELRVNGHLVVVLWDWPRRTTVFGYVCLYNGAVFEITLCDHYRGVGREIAWGHCFNWDTREIIPLKCERNRSPFLYTPDFK